MQHFHSWLYRTGMGLRRFFRQDISIGARIYLSAFFIIAVILFSYAIHYASQHQFTYLTRTLLDTRFNALSAVQSAKESIYSHNYKTAQYIATRDPQLLRDSEKLHKTTELEVERLHQFLDNSVMRGRVSQLRKDLNEYFRESDLLIQRAQKDELPANAGLFQAADWARNQDQRRLKLLLLGSEKEEALTRVMGILEELVTYSHAKIEEDQGDINARLQSNLKMGAAIAVTAAVLILLLTLGLAASLLGSLRLLLGAVRQVVAGNYDLKIPSQGAGELNELSQTINTMAREIQTQRARLIRENITDELTGSYNQRHSKTLLKNEWERAKRTRQPLSVLMVDADNFKANNDKLGHEYGNEILKVLARTLQENLRNMDSLIRYGGDEFCVILPNTGVAEAHSLAERLIHAVRKNQLLASSLEPSLRVTISVGGATYPSQAESQEDLVQRADQALYEAKKTGRDALRWAGRIHQPGSVKN